MNTALRRFLYNVIDGKPLSRHLNSLDKHSLTNIVLVLIEIKTYYGFFHHRLCSSMYVSHQRNLPSTNDIQFGIDIQNSQVAVHNNVSSVTKGEVFMFTSEN